MDTPGTAYLTGWWKLDEASGTRYNSGTLIGKDFTEVGSLGNRSGRIWRSPYAADFTGANGLTATHDFSIAHGGMDLMFAFWLKVDNITGSDRVISKYHVTGTKEYLVNINQDSVQTNKFRVRWLVFDSTNTPYEVAADSFGLCSEGVWYFICCYHDDSANEIGIGINDVWNTAYAAQLRPDTSEPLRVGTESDSINYLDGAVQDLVMWTQQLPITGTPSWMYNNGYGRTYEDIIDTNPPTVSIEPDFEAQDVYVLNNSLSALGVIDDYYSLIWAERYNTDSDFEMDLPVTYYQSSFIEMGNFLKITNSDKIMMIEGIKSEDDGEKELLRITGRSVEAILDRRVLLNPKLLSGPVEWSVYNVLLNNITGPTNSDRKISIFTPDVPSMHIDKMSEQEYDTETVYEIVKDLCQANGLGFKAVQYWDATQSKETLYFYVYEGKDHSTSQSENLWVVFSDDFENVLNSSYYKEDKEKVNVVLVRTDDTQEDLQRVFVWGTEGIKIPPSNLLTNLISWWEMNTSSYLDSHLNKHLTASGTPVIVNGKVGNGVDLEYASNEMLYYNSSSDTDVDPQGGSFTIGAWVRPESNDGDSSLQAIITKREYTASASVYILRRNTTDGTIQFYLADSGGTWNAKYTTATAPVGDWSFIVAYWDADLQTMGVSINGGVFVTASPSITLNTYISTRVAIGGRWNIYPTQETHFDGIIDEAFFYKGRALSLEEVEWLYNDGYGRSYQEVYDISNSLPTDINRFESIIEESIDRDVVTPSLTDWEVLGIITAKGRAHLEEYKSVRTFDGDFDVKGSFRYGTDFFLGDIVQCNIHGEDTKARVIELTRSYSADGEKTYVGLDFSI